MDPQKGNPNISPNCMYCAPPNPKNSKFCHRCRNTWLRFWRGIYKLVDQSILINTFNLEFSIWKKTYIKEISRVGIQNLRNKLCVHKNYTYNRCTYCLLKIFLKLIDSIPNIKLDILKDNFYQRIEKDELYLLCVNSNVGQDEIEMEIIDQLREFVGTNDIYYPKNVTYSRVPQPRLF